MSSIARFISGLFTTLPAQVLGAVTGFLHRRAALLIRIVGTVLLGILVGLTTRRVSRG